MSLVSRVLNRLRSPAAAPPATAPRAAAPTAAAPPEEPWAAPHAGMPTFRELSEEPHPSLVPPLDRPDLDEAPLMPEQHAWRRDGVLVLRGFLPDSVTDPYIERRARLEQEMPEHHRGGWRSPTPYLHVPELAAVTMYPPLMDMLERVIGEQMMMHLNLTGWVSTERDWHQDDYLNPGDVNSWYVAVWIALGHVHERCGPFEYVPGSHRWPLLRQAKVRQWMSPAELAERGAAGVETWPKRSERFVVPAIEAEIAARGGQPTQFLAEKGDVLIWHGRLLHRGTAATGPDILRPAVIAHYSGINHRADMPARRQDAAGNWYAVFDTPLE